MHKILLIVSIILLLPFHANGECTTQNNACISYDGCYLATLMGALDCQQCDPGYYNNSSTGLTNECTPCPTSYGMSGKIPDINAQDYEQSECPWTCDENYYINDANTDCELCPNSNRAPTQYSNTTNIGNCSCGSTKKLIKTNGNEYYCGLCGVGISGTTSTNKITQCNCASVYGANNVHGSKVEYSNIRVECACPEGATLQNGACVCTDPNKSLTLDSTTNTYVCSSCTSPYATNDGNGTCTCNAGYYGTINGLNTVCHACPTNSTSVVNGVANAAGATSIDQCKCEQNYPIRSTNATTGAVTCSACPSNATSYTTGTDFEYECKCDANYYGNGYISCDKCPAGTTKSIGGSSGSNGRQAPTTQADCKFSNNTKFCVPSNVRTATNDGYVCFTPTNVTYTY